MRLTNLALASILALSLSACTTNTPGSGLSSDSEALRKAEILACGLDDDDSVTADPDAVVHACDPGDTRKTTICHIPPGNPANAHTICVGNPAAHAHVQNHGDTLGKCPSEPPCDGGGDGSGSGGDGSGSGGDGSGSGSGSGAGSGSGSGGDGGGGLM